MEKLGLSSLGYLKRLDLLVGLFEKARFVKSVEVRILWRPYERAAPGLACGASPERQAVWRGIQLRNKL